MRKGALNLFSYFISSSSSMLAKESNVDGTSLVLILENEFPSFEFSSCRLLNNFFPETETIPEIRGFF